MRDPNEAPWPLVYDGIEPLMDVLCHTVTIAPLDPDCAGTCLQFFRPADGPTSCYINFQGRYVEFTLSPEAIASLSSFFANAAL